MSKRNKKSGEQSPPAKPVPPVNATSSGGAREMLFTPDGVSEIAEKTGIPLAPGVDKDRIAKDLHDAFDLSLTAYGLDKSHAAAAEKREWFAGLQSSATTLLNALGYDAPPHEILRSSATNLVSRQNLVNEVFRSDLYQRAILPPEQIRKLVDREQLNADLAFREESAADEGRAVQPIEQLQTLHRATVLPLLEIAPWLVALLAELGRTGAERYAGQAGKKTKQNDNFRRVLFLRLAGAYEAMTGSLPNVRAGEKRDPGLPAVQWFQEVLTAASERVDSVLYLENASPSEPIRELAAKKPGTLAGYIEDGKTACNRQKSRATTEFA